jgi:hypothetical protein
MIWFFDPLEDDMWSPEGIFKSDEEYMEELLKTEVIKYRKGPFFNALKSCIDFEAVLSPGGGSDGIQTEKRYIVVINDLFELESKGKIQPTTGTSQTLSTPHFSDIQGGNSPAKHCLRRGFGTGVKLAIHKILLSLIRTP